MSGTANGSALRSVPVGVVGLGLMGTSIATCLLAAGHAVTGITRSLAEDPDAPGRVRKLLEELQREGMLVDSPDTILGRFRVSEDCADLAGAQVVIESIFEDLDLKRAVIRRIEDAVDRDCLIGSNTSATPVTELQSEALEPRRILGIHWAEPAHITRFMEVICGRQTAPDCAERALAFARLWGKEPTFVQRDVRGFITNRIMYAMLREAFHLVEAGYATPADIDRSVRNDLGWWITLAGPFRFMDLTGIPAYEAVMRDLLPELDCSTEVPKLMRDTVASGARGVSNARGFYQYTPEQARQWEEVFLRFSYEIRRLAMRYPEDAGDH